MLAAVFGCVALAVAGHRLFGRCARIISPAMAQALPIAPSLLRAIPQSVSPVATCLIYGQMLSIRRSLALPAASSYGHHARQGTSEDIDKLTAVRRACKHTALETVMLLDPPPALW